MIRNKYIVFPLLLSVWAIIFAHNVVPHHHHHVNVEVGCNDCHLHDANYTESVEIHGCSHECNDHACYFDVDFLTQLSIDTIFLANIENGLVNYFSAIEINLNSSYIEFVPDQITRTNHLRGPPVIS